MTDHREPHHAGLLTVACACMFLFGVILLLMGSMLPSLEVSYARAGNLGSIPLTGILVATIFVGPILDRFGAKSVLASGLALVALALGLIPFLHHYEALLAAAFLYGLGGGLLNIAANALVAALATTRRAAWLNLLGFFFSLGAIAAPLLMSSARGGLSVLPVMSVLAVVILISTLLLPFPVSPPSGTSLGSLLAVLQNPTVWLFGVLLFFESASENCMFVWSGRIVALVTGTSPQKANLALAGLSAAFGAGRLLAVLWLRFLDRRAAIWASCAVAALGALLASASQQFHPMTAGILVAGLGLSSIFPTVLGMAADSFPGNTGTVFGAIIAVALIGGTTGPRLAALIAGAGPAKVFLIPVSGAAAVAILATILTRRTRQTRPQVVGAC